jgi:glycosyltransferase involved in cell wall biosynthesis
MPMTVIEAMGCGLPVIATDVGGISDMVTNEKSAILVNNTTEELTNAIIRLYSSPCMEL